MEATSVDGTVMAMPDNEVKGKKAIAKEELKEEIVAMAVMNRADKRRYGNLQISLKILYLLGGDIYPDTIPDVLRVLNTYKTERTPSTTHPPTPLLISPGDPGTGGRNISRVVFAIVRLRSNFPPG